MDANFTVNRPVPHVKNDVDDYVAFKIFQLWESYGKTKRFCDGVVDLMNLRKKFYYGIQKAEEAMKSLTEFDL